MNILRQVQAGRHVDKLKQSRRLPPAELQQAQDELIALGPMSIPALLDCLGHGEARNPAIAVLERLATGKPWPVRGCPGLAQPRRRVGGHPGTRDQPPLRPTRPLALLFDTRIPKSALDSILSARFSDIRPVALIDLLPDLGKEGRAIVFRILERTEDPVAKQRLIPLLSHEDWSMRMQVTKILSRTSEPSSNTAIRALLHDEHRTARLEAVKAIHSLGDRAAVPDMVGLLRDPDLKVQTAAIDALVRLADASAVPHLLRGAEGRIRVRAAGGGRGAEPGRHPGGDPGSRARAPRRGLVGARARGRRARSAGRREGGGRDHRPDRAIRTSSSAATRSRS